ncbi:MAG: serine/threonine-protein kinase [Acidobacteria bacterium]|nr:serine/threonine-protein kinase [Acidobacteriota bacterium]
MAAMQAERWLQIDRLLDEALALPTSEREAFLAQVSDEELRREVASLLKSHDQAEANFLNQPALEIAAQKLAQQEATLIGQHFGAYQILSVLGAGGMGEVYLARDERLGRSLALKLLPPHFVADAPRVERFTREARAVSALNHPNIVTVYDIGERAGIHYLAMEHVDGQTLRSKLHTAHPHKLEEKEIVEIALQIAAALRAAHETGIVHRDIKPENVMVRRDGFVKVLDFGLAKLTDKHRALAETVARTRSGEAPQAFDPHATRPGSVMGTARYMSPEQALGRDVDARSDIFSLGIVLYELLAGTPPFKGDTPAATLDAIVHYQPVALTHVRPELNPECERLITRMLEKDRELRYQTANDLRSALKRLQRELDSASHPISATSAPSGANAAVTGGRRNKWFAVAAVLSGLLAVIAATWWLTRTPATETLSRESFNELQITDFPGEELFPSLSPDGQSVVYARRSKEGDFDIWQQRIGGTTPNNLTAKNAPAKDVPAKDVPAKDMFDDTHPAYSPDGAFIAFRSERDGGGLFLMGATGESVRRLADHRAYHPAWSPDGKEVIYTEEPIDDPRSRILAQHVLHAVKIDTMERRIVSKRDVAQPAFSPHGQRIAYWAQGADASRDIWTMPASGGDAIAVTNDAATDWNPVWSPDGKYLYFSSDRTGAMNLWRVPIDEQTGRTQGAPQLVPTPSGFSQHLSFSKDGTRMAFVDKRPRYRLASLPFDTARPSKNSQQDFTITETSWRTYYPDVSPDGGVIVYNATVGNREDLYLVKTDGSALPQKLTDDDDKDRYPRWSPTGERIAFFSNRGGGNNGGRWQIWTINRDGGARQQVTNLTEGDAFFPTWSPTGDRLAYIHRKTNPDSTELFIVDLTQPLPTKGQPQPYDPTIRFWLRDWSPDGKRLIGGWRANIEAPLLVKNYSLETHQFEDIGTTSADPGNWLNDNRRYLAEEYGRIFLLDSRTGASTELLSRLPYQLYRLTLPADQRTLYFGLDISEANVWVLSRK